VSVPAGGLAGAITIAESMTWRLTATLDVRPEESVTPTMMGYVPAVAGLPDNCPEVLSSSPGGSPDALQLKGGVPPDAINV
jgi:hypothetical protein